MKVKKGGTESGFEDFRRRDLLGQREENGNPFCRAKRVRLNNFPLNYIT
jgi:hypothetical protein